MHPRSLLQSLRCRHGLRVAVHFVHVRTAQEGAKFSGSLPQMRALQPRHVHGDNGRCLLACGCPPQAVPEPCRIAVRIRREEPVLVTGNYIKVRGAGGDP